MTITIFFTESNSGIRFDQQIKNIKKETHTCLYLYNIYNRYLHVINK